MTDLKPTAVCVLLHVMWQQVKWETSDMCVVDRVTPFHTA